MHVQPSAIAAFDEASVALEQGQDPQAIASRWGAVDASSRRLLVVRPADQPWDRIQVVVDDDGRAEEVVFDYANDGGIAVTALIDAYGDPVDEEDAMDGPLVVWFQPEGTRCRIGAWVRRVRRPEQVAGRVAVVAPMRS
jgi:hypothetical protein